MPYALFTVPTSQRALKKLPEAVRHHLLSELQTLRTNPLLGAQLKGKFRALRSLHTRYKGTDYRVVYQVHEKEQAITVWYAASRENFYRSLEKLPLPE